MRWCVRVVSVVSLLVLVLGGVLLLLFACGQTQFFLLLGLSDPSNPEWTLVGRGGLERGTLAGYWCGLLISGVLAVSTAATCWVFSAHVEGDAAALDEAVRIWEEKQVDLAAGHLQPGDVVAALRDGVPAHTRLGHLFQAWSGPGKTGDVESFIEARASVPRQILVYLVTVASTLVLVGLVGNFFGLAEAVRQIPDLKQAQGPARAQAGVKAQPPASGTETGTVRLGSGKTVTKLSTYDRSREQGPSSLPVAAHDRSGSLLSKISAGLSVVVVSSVMGIGAMLVLLLHAGAVRGTLNSLVAPGALPGGGATGTSTCGPATSTAWPRRWRRSRDSPGPCRPSRRRRSPLPRRWWPATSTSRPWPGASGNWCATNWWIRARPTRSTTSR